MNKPKDCTSFPFYFVLDECKQEIMKGDMVLYMFYEQGVWKDNHIPKELKEKNWKPEEDKTYKIWYHYTNPADPADSGYAVLDYIEEVNNTNINNEKKPILTLTPIESKRLCDFIKEHPDDYIELYETLGLGMSYFLEVSTDNTNEKIDITDYDSF